MVYLVDDDLDDLDLVQESLAEYSYKGPVSVLTNGDALLKDLALEEKEKPHLIILDLNMPLVDGFTALHRIKTNPKLKSIPVIILTASSNKADAVRCFELGCDYFFVKPTRPSEYAGLTAIVKRMLVRKELSS